MEQKLGVKKCLKIGVYLAKFTSFMGILKDTVPFVTGISVNSNQIFLSVESAGQIFHFLTRVCYQVTLSVVPRLFRKMEPSISSLSVAVITVNSGFTCKQGERVHFCFVLTFSPRSKQKNIDRRLNCSNSYWISRISVRDVAKQLDEMWRHSDDAISQVCWLCKNFTAQGFLDLERYIIIDNWKQCI